MQNALPINELFETLQGEATYTGSPAIFVRLQGCDVGCPWCDTKHTWEWPKEAPQLSTAEMLAKVNDAKSFAYVSQGDLFRLLAYPESTRFKSHHVVFTGGEPAAYDLNEVSTRLIDRGYTVQLETSGTYLIRIDPRAWVTVSPKFDMPGGREVLPEAMHRANEIKLPVGKLKDIRRARDVMGEFHPNGGIWLQPLSCSPKATQLCVDAAMQYGFRVSLQAHKFAGLR